MDNVNRFISILVWSVFMTYAVAINGHTKRLLVDNPEDLESRFHQMELSLQSLTAKVGVLTSQASQKDHFITQLQSTVISLQSMVTKLEHTNQNQSLQIQTLQGKVNAKKPGCQTGHHQLTDSKGHANTTSSVIHFNPPFEEVPQIVWGATALDVDHTHNTRFATSIQQVTTTGFMMESHTWADTGLYSVSIQWMACPAHI